MEFIYVYYIVGGLVWAIVWGYAVNAVIRNKGYTENWFWWGFFFEFIALIVALTKPDNTTSHTIYSSSTIIEPVVASSDSWKCAKCGRYNTGMRCDCGMYKGENDKYKRQQYLAKQHEEEEKRKKAEEETRAKAEEEARIKAEEEARIRAEVEARIKAEAEAGIITGENLRMSAREGESVNTEERSGVGESEKAKYDKFTEIKQYKELLDCGIITVEEFNKKKAELLDL